MSGGPNYGAKGDDIVGSYSGVLIPTTISSSILGPNGEPVPSLGVFSIKVPVTGYATGIFTMFAEGKTYPGTITAAANALKGTITGLFQAQFDRTILYSALGTGLEDKTVTTSVNGTLKAKVASTGGVNYAASATGNTFQRVTGNAVLVYDEGLVNSDLQPIITNILEYTVDGVKQSNSSTTTDASTTTTGV